MEALICGSCKKEKPISEFTKSNRGKGKGLCRECKKTRDAEHRLKKEKENSQLKHFKLIPDMISRKNTRARIGVLILERIHDRGNAKDFIQQSNQGLNAILNELCEPHEYCKAEFINSYEFVLVSLTSVMDVENLIYTMEKFAPSEIKAKIIIGGFGVINIKLLLPYIDIAVFGRAEGQINDIIAGARFSNTWSKQDDPQLQGRYAIRQPRYLVKGEAGIGCRNKCRFCQYTYIRKALNSNQKYNPGTQLNIQETDWAGLTIGEAGRYTSAWDGWSEETRRKVAKPITDSDIINKLLEIDNKHIKGAVNIKVFQIVGYPWETAESVQHDISKAGIMLKEIDSQINTKILLAFLCTPFGPEPLTPMQYDTGDINTNWREVIDNTEVYKGKNITAFITPVISGPFTLMKRMFIHRAETAEIEIFKAIAFDSRLKRLPERWKVPWLLKHGYIDSAMFGQIDKAAFDYLYIERVGGGVKSLQD